MKLHKLIETLVFSGALLIIPASRAEDSKALLEKFKAYEQGKTPALVTETRQALFAGTADEAVRAERERDLLAFIASDAHPQAKAIAIEWLGCLGSAASVPGLLEALKTPALAAPVAAALERIPEPEAPHAKLATPKNQTVVSRSVAEVAKFTDALNTVPNKESADRLIIEALRSPNDHLAGAALRRIRTGAGTSAKLIAALDQVPLTRQPAFCEALSTRSDAAMALHSVLSARARNGGPESRAAAVLTLGRILSPDDLPFLLGLAASEGSPEVSAAARSAFSRATDPGINAALIQIATAPGNAQALVAIEMLAERSAVEAVTPLWKLVEHGDAKTTQPALKALGTLINPADLPALLKRFVAADGTPLADAFAKTTWDVARRHPDPTSAAALLAEASTTAPPDVKERLGLYATRIRTTIPAGRKAALDLPKQDDRQSLAPNGHAEVIYLNCGSATEARSGNAIIRRTGGQSYQFGAIAHPLATVDFGKDLTYEISGLDPNADYVLGFSAWDADLGKRRQSLQVDGKDLLSEFVPLAWHADKPAYARIHLPLPRNATADGNATITLKTVSGPNAVLSELWLLRRTATANTNTKRVVIITGDDHPAHHWRETAPEFAKILRADPRLEVTISESPALLGSPALASYDAVFLHFKNYADRLPTAKQHWSNLERYVQGGGGLVIAHFGCGAMQEWSGYSKLAGRVWDPKKRGHDPYGEFSVRITGKEHPISSGLTHFDTSDELYTCFAGDAVIEVLAEATSKIDQGTHPMAFVLRPGKGRVFHSPLGHDLGALKSDGTRALYLRGTLWAAGLESH